MLPHHLSGLLFRRALFDYWQSVHSFQMFVDCSAVIVGKANSFLKPMYYIIIFSTFDIISLIIQAVGGAGASMAEQNGTDTTPSTHIMVCPTYLATVNY
jgi:hypothetical protein